MMIKRLLCACLFCLPLSMAAQAVENPWTLEDQFERVHTLDGQVEVLLVAVDMDGSKMVNEALQGAPEGYLQQRNALFVANVSAMPALISKLFAVPKMRKYDYPVLLDHDGEVAARYPTEPGKVMLIRLQDGEQQTVQALDSATALRGALDALE